MNTSDARVRYTRMVIQQAFFDLLREKPVSRITVKELCQRCEINRATFYRHYQDPFDLLEKAEEEVLRNLHQAVVQNVSQGATTDFGTFLLSTLKHLQESGDIYLLLGSENGDPTFPVRVFMTCYQSVYPDFEQRMQGMPAARKRLLYYFLSQGCSGVMSYWFNSGMEESPEEVSEFIMDASSILTTGFSQRV